MKTNVTYLNTKYVLNTKDDTVYLTCNLTSGINVDNIPNFQLLVNNENFAKHFSRIIDNSSRRYSGIKFTYNDSMIMFNTYGIAKCPVADYDEDLGKKLSHTRAQENAFKIAKQIYDEMYCLIMQHIVSPIESLWISSDLSVVSCKNHANDLIDEYYKVNNNE